MCVHAIYFSGRVRAITFIFAHVRFTTLLVGAHLDIVNNIVLVSNVYMLNVDCDLLPLTEQKCFFDDE